METPPPRTTGGHVAPGFTVSPRELRAKARALAGRGGCSPGASPAATALRPSRPPARGPPAATPEVQAAAAPLHRSGRGRGKCKLPADLDDDAFMRTAEEVDPDMHRNQISSLSTFSWSARMAPKNYVLLTRARLPSATDLMPLC
eukprot:jgi/Tetstr1/420675/TSEL_011762.t1